MSLKNCLISIVLAMLAGCIAGYWLSNLQWEARDARMNESQALQETERLEKAMEENRNLHETVNQMQVKKQKEENEAKKKYDDLLARVNRGAVRVSIPARACSELPADGRSSDADRETRAELDPTVVERIFSVGRDGDEAIRELNLCLDQYQAVARACYN